MSKFDALITVASWEERFLAGAEITINEIDTDKIFMFYYTEYQDRTKENRNKVRKICSYKSIELTEIEVSFKKYVDTWKIFRSTFLNEEWKEKEIIVDITTMPRESIWTIFYFLDYVGAEITYRYYRPEKYNDEWLSRDPGRPRLMLKQSGVAKLGAKTVLIVVTGFDSERTEQLINYFEPIITILALQKGDQYSNDKYNISQHERIKGYVGLHKLEIDAYSPDNGYQDIISEVKKYIDDYNVVLSSLGPKPSAVALFRVWKTYPEVALAYAPSNEINPDYSEGIDENIIVGSLTK